MVIRLPGVRSPSLATPGCARQPRWGSVSLRRFRGGRSVLDVRSHGGPWERGIELFQAGGAGPTLILVPAAELFFHLVRLPGDGGDGAGDVEGGGGGGEL